MADGVVGFDFIFLSVVNRSHRKLRKTEPK